MGCDCRLWRNVRSALPGVRLTGNSVTGHVASLLSFQFNVDAEFPRTLAIDICRTLKWTSLAR